MLRSRALAAAVGGVLVIDGAGLHTALVGRCHRGPLSQLGQLITRGAVRDAARCTCWHRHRHQSAGTNPTRAPRPVPENATLKSRWAG